MSTLADDILTRARAGEPVIMGVLNVTPDSFSDGGDFLAAGAAVDQARQMIAGGADVIDIGAESTRPGSERVTADDQIGRLREIVPAVVQLGSPVSIDTTSAAVARFAFDAGAAIVNDVSAGRDDPSIFDLAAERAAPICLMHMLGQPKTMQAEPHYEDVVGEVRDFLADRRNVAVAAGVDPGRIILDPGIGFGKTLQHNLRLLGGVEELAALGHPVLIGASRKRFIGELTGVEAPADRVPGTLAACLAAWQGGATIFRVHDVAATAQAFAVARAITEVR
ncbi:MAG: dihydropteroate synthase [Planctomycetota bacterium]|jgi:dihydropteroate synthase